MVVIPSNNERRKRISSHRILLYSVFALDLSLLISLSDVVSLVKELLSFSDPKFALYDSSLKIDLERNEGQPSFSGDTSKAFDLLAVHKELASTKRVVIGSVAECVWSHMEIHQPQLAFFHGSVGVREGESSFLNGLDFCPFQGDPALEAFLDGVVEPRFPVECEDLDSLIGLCHRRPLWAARNAAPGG